MSWKTAVSFILLVSLLCVDNAEARQPPFPLITSYKIRTVEAYLTAYWVPAAPSKKTVTEAEVILMERKLAEACKGKTRSTCKKLAEIIHQGNPKGPQPIRITRYPRNRWNYGKEYHQMMAAAKKKTRTKLNKRLYRWLARRIARKKLRKNPSPSLDAHLYQSANIGYEPPLGSLKPIRAVILEVYTGHSAIPRLHVLDLKF